MPENKENGYPQDETENGYSEEEVVSLIDEAGRELPCHIEDFFEFEGKEYVVLIPIDSTVDIFACDDEAEEAIVVEDEGVINEILPIAEAVLAEKNLKLKRTPFVLTVEGELPPAEEEDIIPLPVPEEEGRDSMEAEELQFLAGFYNEEQKYEIYALLDPPLVFVGRLNQEGKAELLSEEEFEKVKPVLEDQPFDELE